MKKKARNYSLFTKEGAKHVRLSSLALPLKDARRIFQGALLGGSMSGHYMELRPAEPDMANDEAYKATRERLFPKEGN